MTPAMTTPDIKTIAIKAIAINTTAITTHSLYFLAVKRFVALDAIIIAKKQQGALLYG